MREIVSTVSSKGQVTVPAEIRRRLGIEPGDKLSFIIENKGDTGEERVVLKASRYPDIASLQGAAGSLAKPLSWDRMLSIAHEDRAQEIADPQ